MFRRMVYSYRNAAPSHSWATCVTVRRAGKSFDRIRIEPPSIPHSAHETAGSNKTAIAATVALINRFICTSRACRLLARYFALAEIKENGVVSLRCDCSSTAPTCFKNP